MKAKNKNYKKCVHYQTDKLIKICNAKIQKDITIIGVTIKLCCRYTDKYSGSWSQNLTSLNPQYYLKKQVWSQGNEFLF